MPPLDRRRVFAAVGAVIIAALIAYVGSGFAAAIVLFILLTIIVLI